MGIKEIQTTLRIAQQYLKPNYNVNDNIEAQKENEEGVFKQIVGVLAKKDQNVLKIWNVVKKTKNSTTSK